MPDKDTLLPDDRQDRRDERGPSRPSERSPEERIKKKPPRKRSKKSLLLLFLLLAAGTGVGLHYTGAWDARPWAYALVPRVPYFGPQLVAAFGIPQKYALTAPERRRLELEERERMINAWASSVDAAQRSVFQLSQDLAARTAVLLSREEGVLRDVAARSAEQGEKAIPDKEIKELLKVYGEMSPRNAAQIMEGLNDTLSVALLSRMPRDQAAAILSKMTPPRAAALTERLSRPSSP